MVSSISGRRRACVDRRRALSGSRQGQHRAVAVRRQARCAGHRVGAALLLVMRSSRRTSRGPGRSRPRRMAASMGGHLTCLSNRHKRTSWPHPSLAGVPCPGQKRSLSVTGDAYEMAMRRRPERCERPARRAPRAPRRAGRSFLVSGSLAELRQDLVPVRLLVDAHLAVVGQVRRLVRIQPARRRRHQTARPWLFLTCLLESRECARDVATLYTREERRDGPSFVGRGGYSRRACAGRWPRSRRVSAGRRVLLAKDAEQRLGGPAQHAGLGTHRVEVAQNGKPSICTTASVPCSTSGPIAHRFRNVTPPPAIAACLADSMSPCP